MCTIFLFFINYYEVIIISISIDEFKKLLNSKNINLIDIRSSYKYSLGTIKSAINIPTEELLYNYQRYLKKDEVYYIFCDSGSSSLRLSNILNSMGYKVYNIAGGYRSYLAK